MRKEGGRGSGASCEGPRVTQDSALQCRCNSAWSSVGCLCPPSNDPAAAEGEQSRMEALRLLRCQGQEGVGGGKERQKVPGPPLMLNSQPLRASVAAPAGMDIVKKIESTPTGPMDRPRSAVIIKDCGEL